MWDKVSYDMAKITLDDILCNTADCSHPDMRRRIWLKPAAYIFEAAAWCQQKNYGNEKKKRGDPESIFSFHPRNFLFSRTGTVMWPVLLDNIY